MMSLDSKRRVNASHTSVRPDNNKSMASASRPNSQSAPGMLSTPARVGVLATKGGEAMGAL